MRCRFRPRPLFHSLAACATVRPDQAPPPAGSGVVSLAVTRRGGDGVALLVEAAQPVYVYAARMTPQGAPEIVSPAGSTWAEQPVAPGAPLLIPAGAAGLGASQDPGAGLLCVLASTAPLSPERVRELLWRDEGSREPPTTLSDKNRGLDGIMGQLDEQGIAVLRFSLSPGYYTVSH